jgi:UPF0716 family protein affecting phage T7 exclusion
MAAIIMPLLGLILLFVELFLLIKLGQGIGFALVLAEILGSGLVGYALMRSARTVFQPAQLIGVFLHGIATGFSSREPVEQLLLGSLLLIIPGILTDIIGLVLIARAFLRGGARPQTPNKPDGSDAIDIEFDIRDDTPEE